MLIQQTINADHLVSERVSASELKSIAESYAARCREALEAKYPDAEIEIEIKYRVTGVGAGVTVDGCIGGDDALSVAALLERG